MVAGYAKKKQLVDSLAEKLSVTKEDANVIVNSFLESLVDVLTDPQYDGVVFRDIFSLTKVVKAARKGKMAVPGQNGSAYGASYDVPERIGLKISLGKTLIELLNPTNEE